jgi:hypothetical protein
VRTGPTPSTAVIRVSRGNFDPARFPEVPAIKKLPGLIGYHAGTSPGGSVVHVSIWESDEHAEQMSRLKEMIAGTPQAYEKAGVTLIPIVNYPIDWTI